MLWFWGLVLLGYFIFYYILFNINFKMKNIFILLSKPIWSFFRDPRKMQKLHKLIR